MSIFRVIHTLMRLLSIGGWVLLLEISVQNFLPRRGRLEPPAYPRTSKYLNAYQLLGTCGTSNFVPDSRNPFCHFNFTSYLSIKLLNCRYTSNNNCNGWTPWNERKWIGKRKWIHLYFKMTGGYWIPKLKLSCKKFWNRGKLLCV